MTDDGAWPSRYKLTLGSDKVLSFDAFNGHVTHVHCHSGAVNDLRIHAARTYTRMKYGPVFILGAVGSNTSDNTTWDHFRVYGLLDKTVYEEEKIQCCLMYKDKDDIITLQTEAISENRFSVPADLWRYHVGCPNVKHTEGIIPIGLSLTVLSNVTCNENHVTYDSPYFSFKEPDKIVLGSKFAFGNVSAELIIEWIEAMKYIGVNKIVTHYLRTLNTDARKVLYHYASEGTVDLYFHELANEDVYPRVHDFSAEKHDAQHWNDESAVAIDSFELNSGCRYFAIIDFDEFIIPGQNKTLREMFEHLEKTHAPVAGFMLRSQYFFVSWGKSSNKSDLIIDSYTMREDKEPRFDHTKGFQIPARVAIGGTETHDITPVDGYKVYDLSIEDGYIRHYRHCRRENTEECLTKTKRILDTSVSEWADGFRENVVNVRKKVLGLNTRG